MIECIKYGEIHYYKNVIENPYELIEQIEKTDSNCTSKTGIKIQLLTVRTQARQGILL